MAVGFVVDAFFPSGLDDPEIGILEYHIVDIGIALVGRFCRLRDCTD
jgi:hypothetical protein